MQPNVASAPEVFKDLTVSLPAAADGSADLQQAVLPNAEAVPFGELRGPFPPNEGPRSGYYRAVDDSGVDNSLSD